MPKGVTLTEIVKATTNSVLMMKQVESVTIEKAIVHLVDSRKSVLTLSSRELTMATGDEVDGYFAAHIRNSLTDAAARTANFGSASKLAPLAFAMMKAPSKFIEHSHALATLLYESSDKRISSGAVAVCLYSSGQFPKVKRFLAILKLDPSDGFHPIQKKDADGNTYVEFRRVENVVPPTGEKLLKCAFIRPAGDEAKATYDLVVLDRQKSSSEEPAHFFVEKFLGAEFFGNAADMTSRFYKTSLYVLDTIRKELGNEKTESVMSAVTASITTGLHIDVDQWVSNLNIKKVFKDKLSAELAAVIPDRAFDVDQALADRLTKKRVFKGAYGFKLTVNSADMEKVIIERTPEKGHERLVLEVPEFKEVSS